MTRRRRVFLLLVLLAALAAYAIARLPSWSASLIASGLGSFFQRPASVGEVRIHVFPLEIEMLDLRVAGPRATDPPFLTIRRVVATPSLAQLWARRAVLSRVVVQAPKIRVHAPPEGGDDIPHMGGPKGQGLELQVYRLVVEDGEVVLDHERVPLRLDLPDFRGRLTGLEGRALTGHIAFGPGGARFGSAAVLPLETEMDLSLEGLVLSVTSARLRAQGTDLTYRGQIRFGTRLTGDFVVRGPTDLEVVERYVLQTGFGLRGAAHYDGAVSLEGPRLRLSGRVEGTGGRFQGVPVPRFAGDVAWDRLGVRIKDLAITAFDGEGLLDVEVPPGSGQAHLRAKLTGVDAEALVIPVLDIGPAGVGASATGDVDIRWPRGRIRRLSGSIAADLAPRLDGRTPLSGRFEWRAEDGVQFVEKADLRTPSTGLNLAGRIELDGRTDMSVDGTSTDLETADELFARVRHALGARDAQPAGLSGSGAFRGRWGGTLQRPVFEGRFSGASVGYLGVVWGAAEWAGAVDPNEVRSHSLLLRRAGGEIWLDGSAQTGLPGEGDGLDVRVRFRDWPARDFTKAFDWHLDLTGLLSGETEVAGTRSKPRGSAHIAAANGRYYDIPYADLDVAVRMRGQVSEFPAGRARVGGGSFSFKGTLTSTGVYDGSVQATDVDVGGLLPPLADGVRLGGSASGTLTLQGPLDKPRLTGRLFSTHLFLGDEGVGATELSLRGEGDGLLTIDGRCRSPRVDLALAGSVGVAPPYTSSLRISAHATSLDPFLRVVVPRVPATLGLVATGEAELRGPLSSPRQLEVDATLPSVEIALPEYPIRNNGPLRLRLAAGRLELPELHLAGEGTELVASGSGSLLGDEPLRLSVTGEADLRALSLLTRRLRGLGAARLALELSGTAREPKLDGLLDLEGAGIRVRGFPQGIEGVRGRIVFSETRAQLSAVTGTIGGGQVSLEGQAGYAKGQLTSSDVRATGRGLALRYPEGLRSLVDADLRFFGDATRQWVTGDVNVRQATWTRRYDVVSELLASGRTLEPQEPSLAEGLRYDVNLRVPGTLTIDNNLATLTARADLKLQGTLGAPVVIGQAEVERGRIYFQANTYLIRRGTLDFLNPQKIDPLFDIEAETRIRSYRVTLKLNGTLERVSPTLSSDPPLTAVQILSLLAGADEATVASLTQVQADQARLAAAGAATLAAGKIAEEVGLERGAERFLGLNRFSINPSLVRSGVTNPTARLTVGRRITPDLSVLYSVDLRGTEERLLSIEYTLSDRLFLLLEQAEPGGLGFDLQLRHSR